MHVRLPLSEGAGQYLAVRQTVGNPGRDHQISPSASPLGDRKKAAHAAAAAAGAAAPAVATVDGSCGLRKGASNTPKADKGDEMAQTAEEEHAADSRDSGGAGRDDVNDAAAGVAEGMTTPHRRAHRNNSKPENCSTAAE